MAYTIVGFKENSGKLDNGREWKNYSVYCTKDDTKVNGKSVQTMRVPADLLQETFPDSKSVIGSRVTFDVDIRTYGGVQKVVVCGINILGKEHS